VKRILFLAGSIAALITAQSHAGYAADGCHRGPHALAYACKSSANRPDKDNTTLDTITTPAQGRPAQQSAAQGSTPATEVSRSQSSVTQTSGGSTASSSAVVSTSSSVSGSVSGSGSSAASAKPAVAASSAPARTATQAFSAQVAPRSSSVLASNSARNFQVRSSNPAVHSVSTMTAARLSSTVASASRSASFKPETTRTPPQLPGSVTSAVHVPVP
jgi:hypothetical protein